jgi:hypothetical protein
MSEEDISILNERIHKIKMDELFSEPSTWEDDEHWYGQMTYDFTEDL